jgi:hypothetical protein
MVGAGKGVGTAAPPVNSPYLMKNVLTNLSMLTNLRMLIDIGDAACYAGGQPVLDLSGQGTHFYRGFDGSAATDDPLFTGSVGGASGNESLQFETVNDTYIRLQSTNPTWVQNIHKTSWVGTMCWIFKPNNTEFYLFSDEQGGGPQGLRVDNVSFQTIRIGVSGGSFKSIAGIDVNPAFTLGA